MVIAIPAGHQNTIQLTPACPPEAPGSYHVELPIELIDEEGAMLDWLIGFTFDTLHASHLDVRIVPRPSGQSSYSNPT